MTEIKCIHCNTKYNIDEDKISNKKKKLRCAKCKEIFTYKRNEDNNEIIIEKAAEQKKADSQAQKEAETKNEVNKIFERLDKKIKDTTDKEESTPPTFADSIGWNDKTNRIYYISFVVIALLLSLNYYRFEITRTIPALGPVYEAIGITSTISGEGLEFANVIKEDYELDGVNYIKVKGYIANNNNKEIKIPEIEASLLNDDAYTLQKQTGFADEEFIEANQRVAFELSFQKPSPLGKYVYLTFIK